MNSDLYRLLSEEEICEAIFSLGASQSPGPDGFNGHFYRRFWPTIGPLVCKEVIQFFQTCTMPAEWNDTHLVLIPKTPNPTGMGSYRPISCCNFRYKIISKVLATRLKKWISILIPENQAAFTTGRAIQDNIIIVHVVLHSFKTRIIKNQDMCLKLDMRKAYDLVDWDCLERLLRSYGFSDTWCNWIGACVRMVRFSVMFNGRPLEFFQPSKGIRQGDPLSPFLFILMTNALSSLVEGSLNRMEIQGIKLNRRGPRLNDCLFADDTILFGKASTEELTRILRIINNYGNVTGQEINPDKSSIFFSKNVEETTKDEILRHMGCQI
ncbi:LINE-1 reverse transcriptase homolog [Linum perenne]